MAELDGNVGGTTISEDAVDDLLRASKACAAFCHAMLVAERRGESPDWWADALSVIGDSLEKAILAVEHARG